LATFRWKPCGLPMPGLQCRAIARGMPSAHPSLPCRYAIQTELAVMMKSPPQIPQNAEQEQFLTILSREEALARFEAALFPRPIPAEEQALAEALGLALAQDVTAQVDVPPFDRSIVDGFAVRAADLAAASE